MTSASRPKVSVIVPCFNQGRFLGDCIDSLLAQTHGNVEIVVVDDGSTDDTPAVASKYAGRIDYVRQENSGPAAARNLGVARSSGEVVAWCDADDLLHPECLAQRVPMLMSDPRVGLVTGSMGFIDENGRELDIQPERFDAPFRVDFYRAVTRNWGGTCGTLIKRRALVECGLMDPMLLTCEDWDLQVRIARKFDLLYDPEVLAFARQVRGSLSRDPILVYDDARRALRKLEAYADSRFRFWRAGRKALFGNLVCFSLFRIRREMRGAARLRAIARILLKRPTTIPIVVAWLARAAWNRLLRLFRLRGAS